MSVGFAESQKQQRRAWEAEAYSDVADKIENGKLTIVNADPAEVARRCRDKAERVLAGERVHSRRGFSSRSDMFEDVEEFDDADEAL